MQFINKGYLYEEFMVKLHFIGLEEIEYIMYSIFLTKLEFISLPRSFASILDNLIAPLEKAFFLYIKTLVV
jgi:hypothetical protein